MSSIPPNINGPFNNHLSFFTSYRGVKLLIKDSVDESLKSVSDFFQFCYSSTSENLKVFIEKRLISKTTNKTINIILEHFRIMFFVNIIFLGAITLLAASLNQKKCFSLILKCYEKMPDFLWKFLTSRINNNKLKEIHLFTYKEFSIDISVKKISKIASLFGFGVGFAKQILGEERIHSYSFSLIKKTLSTLNKRNYGFFLKIAVIGLLSFSIIKLYNIERKFS
jgi:hypothetical protein